MKTIMRWADRLGPAAWLLGLTAMTWAGLIALCLLTWRLWGAS